VQQALSRKKQGSHRRKKAVKKVAKAHRKVRNQRADFLHKESRNPVNTYELMVFVSDGRVELGLGAGNWQHEYQQLGMSFDTAGTRVSRFAEGLSIIKQFFTAETVNFSGKYYTIAELRSLPRPVQQPHPPIVIGSGGRRMLTIAAREADIILPISMQGTDLEEKIGWIREAAGERFEHLELGKAAFGIELTDSPVAAAPSFPGMPVEARPMTTEQAVTHLMEQRERLGISYIQIQERQLENFAPVVARLNDK